MILLRLLLAAVLAVVPGTPDRAAPIRPGVEAAGLLRAWDEHRAAAWAQGDPAALRDLYTRGSAAGRTDRAMLRAWRARGLRVEGLRVQLLSVRVLSRSERSMVLAVTDRVVGGTVVGAGVRASLPRDLASSRTVTLRRVAGEWRMAAVAGQASPARSTSSTVRSRNR